MRQVESPHVSLQRRNLERSKLYHIIIMIPFVIEVLLVSSIGMDATIKLFQERENVTKVLLNSVEFELFALVKVEIEFISDIKL